jgi:hypothetical protein
MPSSARSSNGASARWADGFPQACPNRLPYCDDPAGALSITGALVLLVYALVEAPDAGWGSLQTILLFGGAAALLAIFAVLESRHRAPLMPLRILRSRTLVGANGVMLLFGTLGSGMPFIVTLYAQQVLGYSPLKFGVSFVVVRLRQPSA